MIIKVYNLIELKKANLLKSRDAKLRSLKHVCFNGVMIVRPPIVSLRYGYMADVSFASVF